MNNIINTAGNIVEDSNTIIEQSDTRFSIDDQGWKRMNAGRTPGHLIRELVSNSFDANVTSVRINLEPGKVVIEDDGAGISDPKLISSVFLTNKESDPTKRGRKGRGSAEIISAAEWAEVETTGFRITFAEGRKTEKCSRTSGTKVTIKISSWGMDEIADAIGYLERIMPPENVAFILNGHRRMGTKVKYIVRNANLATHVIRDGVQREERRDTEIWIRNLRQGESEGSLYEMGIPVQAIGTPYHIDVQQRVPMNDNRDVVSEYYKSELYTYLLDATTEEFTKPMLSEAWAQSGVPYAARKTKKAYINKFIGEGNIAIKTDNKHANDKVKQDGFELVDISHLSWQIRGLIEEVVPLSTKLAKDMDDSAPIEDKPEYRDRYPKFVELYEWLAHEVTQTKYNISFFSRSPSFNGTLNVAEHKLDTIRFNVLNVEFKFDQPLSPELLGSLSHELAHHYAGEHDEKFITALDGVTGRLSYTLWQKRSEIEAILGGEKEADKASVGRLYPVACTWEGCKEVRLVHKADLWLVRRCKTHQKEHQKIQARLRRESRG